MDINKIKIVLMADEYGSFKKVAEMLDYTPSAVLHIVDSVENELGVKLFERSNRGARFNEAGKKLKGKLQKLVDAEDELRLELDNLAGRKQMELRIGTYSSIATYILPEILKGFKKKYPGIQIFITVDNSIGELFVKNHIDVVISDSIPQKNARWIPVMEDEYVVVAEKNSFEQVTEIDRESLYRFPYLQTDDTVIDEYFDYSRFDEIIPMKSVENNSAISMVRENIGITVLPGLFVSDCPNGVKSIKLVPKLSREIGIACKTGKLSYATECFIDYISE